MKGVAKKNKSTLGVAILVGVLLCGAAMAAVEVREDGIKKGVVEKINFTNVDVTRAGTAATVDLSSVTNIQSDGINWTDLQLEAVGKSGVNWQFLTTASNGINWTVAANGATAANIMCWKSNGQPGKCSGGVSGSACGSCL